jgi:hypothetical protein
LRQRRQLFETNGTYAAYLTRAYAGATLTISQESGFYADRRIVHVKIRFGERGPPTAPVCLAEGEQIMEDRQRRWLIYGR